MGFKREYTVNELCETVFYLSRYAECLELDKAISVPDERELLQMVCDWAKEFEQAFDPDRDHQAELESKGTQWLLENFPFVPELDAAPDRPSGMMELSL